MESKTTEIFNRFSDSFLKSSSATVQQLKVINCIKTCKTEAMGYHKERCEDCGHKSLRYNSCNNRHCPNCQAVNKERWLLEKQYDLLPVKYFHTVFTLPAELRTLFLFNKKLLYNLLFTCAWQTIKQFSKDKRNRLEAKTGMIAVLHTWKQNIDYHPHLHCIIPAGGITENGKWKSSPSDGDYLFPVEALSDVFKGKFMQALKSLYRKKELNFPDRIQKPAEYFFQQREALYVKDWVVYSKESFKTEASVFEYLGRYTHRVAISNHRIKEITNESVSFEYTDRNDDHKKKIRTLKGEEFIKLFLRHVLPKGFVKIRSYGFLSARTKTDDLTKLRDYFNLSAYEKAPKLNIAEILERVWGIQAGICPKCGGKLKLIDYKARPGEYRRHARV
jgi:hypothetical protein